MKKNCWVVLLWCAAANVWAQAAPSQDWTLQQVLDRVAVANRDVLAARRALDGAQADRVTAGVSPAPVLSVSTLSINPANLGQGSLWTRPVDTIVRVDTPFERGGKAAWREKVADLGVQAARLDVDDVVRQQQMAAAQAYWSLKLAQEQWQISRANEALALSSSDLARTRMAQGDLSRLEATRLSVEAQRAANERDQARQQWQAAQIALTQLLALDPVAIAAQDAWPDVPATLTANDTSSIEARPDVLAAVQRVAQAEAALSLAQAQRSADVTVGLQFEHNPPTGARLWGVGLSVPLGVDGRQDGPVTKARLGLEMAQADLDRVRATAVADLVARRLALSVAQDRADRIEHQLLPQAREAARAADFARQQGALSLQDVLDARRTLHAAEIDAAAAHADVALALAALSPLSLSQASDRHTP
ncbi:MAG: TolC family protein [Burkholderiales bacterium]|nr:TolC family protein [Burkholderiales bacterium]